MKMGYTAVPFFPESLQFHVQAAINNADLIKMDPQCTGVNTVQFAGFNSKWQQTCHILSHKNQTSVHTQ